MSLENIKTLAQKVYQTLGSGFSERVYHNAMEVLFRIEGIPYETERIVPIVFEGHTIGNMRADLIVEKSVIVELKATKSITPAMITQSQKYLQLLGLSQALLVNFPQPVGDQVELVVVEPCKLAETES
jgi:GxxExxY protein